MNSRSATLTLLCLTFSFAAVAHASQGEHGRSHRVSICHATHSETNPFVLVTVGVAAETAHDHHQDNEDLLFHKDVNLKSGPTDAQSCDLLSGPGPR